MKLTLNKNRLILNKTRTIIPGWTPKNAYMWWDAADASTVTVEPSTNKVLELRDKGPSGVNLSQSVASKQPLFNKVTQNNHSSISFDHTLEQILKVSLTSQNIKDMVFAIAFKPTAFTNKYGSVISYSGNSKDFQFDPSKNDTGEYNGYFRSTGYYPHTFDTSNSKNVPQILSLVGDTSTAELIGYKDGVQKWVEPNYNGWDNSGITIRLGTGRYQYGYLSMDFYEMVVAPKEDYKLLHEYLKHKWNI